MPLVLAYRDPNIVAGSLFSRIINGLPEIVAAALTVPGTDGELAKKDIEVWVCDRQEGDVNALPLAFIIFAGFYPARQDNLNQRRDQIIDGVRELMRPAIIRGCVWILLSPDSFGEF